MRVANSKLEDLGLPRLSLQRMVDRSGHPYYLVRERCGPVVGKIAATKYGPIEFKPSFVQQYPILTEVEIVHTQDGQYDYHWREQRPQGPYRHSLPRTCRFKLPLVELKSQLQQAYWYDYQNLHLPHLTCEHRCHQGGADYYAITISAAEAQAATAQMRADLEPSERQEAKHQIKLFEAQARQAKARSQDLLIATMPKRDSAFGYRFNAWVTRFVEQEQYYLNIAYKLEEEVVQQMVQSERWRKQALRLKEKAQHVLPQLPRTIGLVEGGQATGRILFTEQFLALYPQLKELTVVHLHQGYLYAHLPLKGNSYAEEWAQSKVARVPWPQSQFTRYPKSWGIAYAIHYTMKGYTPEMELGNLPYSYLDIEEGQIRYDAWLFKRLVVVPMYRFISIACRKHELDDFKNNVPAWMHEDYFDPKYQHEIYLEADGRPQVYTWLPGRDDQGLFTPATVAIAPPPKAPSYEDLIEIKRDDAVAVLTYLGQQEGIFARLAAVCSRQDTICWIELALEALISPFAQKARWFEQESRAHPFFARLTSHQYVLPELAAFMRRPWAQALHQLRSTDTATLPTWALVLPSTGQALGPKPQNVKIVLSHQDQITASLSLADGPSWLKRRQLAQRVQAKIQSKLQPKHQPKLQPKLSCLWYLPCPIGTVASVDSEEHFAQHHYLSWLYHSLAADDSLAVQLPEACSLHLKAVQSALKNGMVLLNPELMSKKTTPRPKSRPRSKNARGKKDPTSLKSMPDARALDLWQHQHISVTTGRATALGSVLGPDAIQGYYYYQITTPSSPKRKLGVYVLCDFKLKHTLVLWYLLLYRRLRRERSTKKEGKLVPAALRQALERAHIVFTDQRERKPNYYLDRTSLLLHAYRHACAVVVTNQLDLSSSELIACYQQGRTLSQAQLLVQRLALSPDVTEEGEELLTELCAQLIGALKKRQAQALKNQYVRDQVGLSQYWGEVFDLLALMADPFRRKVPTASQVISIAEARTRILVLLGLIDSKERPDYFKVRTFNEFKAKPQQATAQATPAPQAVLQTVPPEQPVPPGSSIHDKFELSATDQLGIDDSIQQTKPDEDASQDAKALQEKPRKEDKKLAPTHDDEWDEEVDPDEFMADFDEVFDDDYDDLSDILSGLGDDSWDDF